MSILPDVCQPLLIVSTSASLSLWEAKFNRLAPSINVVVYNGEKDVRKQIQDLEFYENGLVTFQVLLSHPDAILEVLVSHFHQHQNTSMTTLVLISISIIQS